MSVVKKIIEFISLFMAIAFWWLLALMVYLVLWSLYGWRIASVVVGCFLLLKYLLGADTTIIKD